MLDRIKMVWRYFQYYLRSTTIYGIHSPIVYNFCKEVLEDDRRYYAFDHLDYHREQLLKDQSIIHVVDLGAGSKTLEPLKRVVAGVAKNSLSTPFFSELLFKLVLQKRPKTVLELGTSLGLSSAYMNLAHRSAQMITIEGCPETAAFAHRLHQQLELKNVRIQKGAFSATLPIALNDLKEVDFAYLDGDHKYESTINYWRLLKPKLGKDAIVVFDDIHWSEGMEKAWKEIIKDPEVAYSADLFFKGVLWVNMPNTSPQHFSLIQQRWKPWKSGLF